MLGRLPRGLRHIAPRLAALGRAAYREQGVTRITRLDKFKVPLTGQEIELQQLDYEGGGMSQVRVRIRERSRFTIVDLDPVTAGHWGEALRQWAQGHASPTAHSAVASAQTVPASSAAPPGAQRDG